MATNSTQKSYSFLCALASAGVRLAAPFEKLANIQVGYPQRFINRLCCQNPLIGKAQQLAQDFIAMVRKQLPIQLTVWIRQAKASGLLGLRRFAAGLEHDYEAVRAALQMPYSNGRVEGQVNRLKYLKRQMYGRASFELLRIRVLNPI
jgi:transposase